MSLDHQDRFCDFRQFLFGLGCSTIYFRILYSILTFCFLWLSYGIYYVYIEREIMSLNAWYLWMPSIIISIITVSVLLLTLQFTLQMAYHALYLSLSLLSIYIYAENRFWKKLAITLLAVIILWTFILQYIIIYIWLSAKRCARKEDRGTRK